MKKFALGIVVLFSCTDPERARDVLEKAGYSNIEITGHSWTGCSDSDSTCTGFTATGPSGHSVQGAVGCGRTSCSKACTIRIE